jgi:hypothetical protein
MSNTLVVITDLGAFKAYRVNFTLQSTPQLELLESFSPPEMDQRYANTLTARTGRSAQGNINLQSAGNNSDGESHGMELELRRRTTRNLAEHISQLLTDRELERCILAAPSEVCPQILDQIDSMARQKVEEVIPKNLTRLPQEDLLKHIQPLL